MEHSKYYEHYEEIEGMPEPYKKAAFATYNAYNAYWRMGNDIGGIGTVKGIIDMQANFRARETLSASLPQLAPHLPDSILLSERKPFSYNLTVGSGPLGTVTTTIIENVTYFLPGTQEIYSFTPAYYSARQDPRHQAVEYDPRHPSFMGFEKARTESKIGGLVFYQTDFSRDTSRRLEDGQLTKILEEINMQISDKGRGLSEELNQQLATIREETEAIRSSRRVYYGNLLQSLIVQLRDAVLDCPNAQSWKWVQNLRRSILLSQSIPLSQVYDREKGEYIDEERRYFFIGSGKIATKSQQLSTEEWTKNHNADYAIEALISFLPNEKYREIIKGLWEPASSHAHREIREENS